MPGFELDSTCRRLNPHHPTASFPPKLDKKASSSPVPLTPSPQTAASSPFWDAKHRASIRAPRYRKRDLDARRSDNLVPGTALVPLAQDDRIPVLLSQRTVASASAGHEALFGWTLTVPAGWGMPFWSSLVYSTPRVGGLRERSQQYQEAQALRFPEDAADTPGFAEYETRRQADEKGYWDRRPSAKRPSYVKLGTASPWKIGMESILATAAQRPEKTAQIQPFVLARSIAERILAAAPREHSSRARDEMQTDTSDLSRPRERAASLERQLLEEWQAVSGAGAGVPTPDLLASAMVHVKVTPCTRGVPQDLALVYELGMDEARQVRTKVDAFVAGKAVLATGEGEGPEDVRVPEADIAARAKSRLIFEFCSWPSSCARVPRRSKSSAGSRRVRSRFLPATGVGSRSSPCAGCYALLLDREYSLLGRPCTQESRILTLPLDADPMCGVSFCSATETSRRSERPRSTCSNGPP